MKKRILIVIILIILLILILTGLIFGVGISIASRMKINCEHPSDDYPSICRCSGILYNHWKDCFGFKFLCENSKFTCAWDIL